MIACNNKKKKKKKKNNNGCDVWEVVAVLFLFFKPPKTFEKNSREGPVKVQMADLAWKVGGVLSGHSDSVLCLDIQKILAPRPSPPKKASGKKGKKPGKKGGGPENKQQEKKEESEQREGACFLCSGAEDGTVRLWDVESKKERGRVSLPDAVNSVAFHPRDAQCLFAASEEKVYQLAIGLQKKKKAVDQEKEEEKEPLPRLPVTVKHTFSFNSDEVNQLSVHFSGDYLAACDDSGEVKIIDLHRRSVFRTLRAHENICSSVQFRPFSAWELSTGGMDCTFTRSNFSTSSTIELVPTNQTDGVATATTYNPPLVNHVCYSQKGEWLVAGLGDYSARVLKISKKRGAAKSQSQSQSQGWVLRGHLGGVTQSSFVSLSEQEMLVTASNDSTIKFWRLPTEADEEPLTSCELSVNHGEKINWMISSGSGFGVRLFIADVTNKITWYDLAG